MTNTRENKNIPNDTVFIETVTKIAQTHIEKAINNYMDDARFADLLNAYKIGKFNQGVEDQASLLLEDAVQKVKLHKKNHFKKIQGIIHFIVGMCQLKKGDYIKAQNSFSDAYKSMEVIGDTEFLYILILAFVQACLRENSFDNRSKIFFYLDQINKEHFKKDDPLKHFYDFQKRAVKKEEDKYIVPLLEKSKEIGTILSKWKKEENPVKKKEAQDELMESKCLYYLNIGEMELAFSCFIFNEIKECAIHEKQGQEKLDRYGDAIKYMLKASEYLPFTRIVECVIHGIRENKENEIITKLDLVDELDKFLIELKNNHGYFSSVADVLLHSFKSSLQTADKKSSNTKKLKSIISKEELVNELKFHAKDVFVGLCGSIEKSPYQSQCESLIDEFYKEEVNYITLRDKCMDIVSALICVEDSLFSIDANHGRIFDILYCIASLCVIITSDEEKNEKILCNALNQLSKFEYAYKEKTECLLNFALGCKRAMNNDIDAKDALKKAQCGLFEYSDKVKEFISCYTKDTNLSFPNEKLIDDLILKFISAVKNNEYQNAFILQGQYEEYVLNGTHMKQDQTFYFWQTMFSFKLREAFSNPMKYNDFILISMRNTLLASDNFVNTFFEFAQRIETDYKNANPYLEKFHEDYIRFQKDNPMLSSPIFLQYIISTVTNKKSNRENIITINPKTAINQKNKKRRKKKTTVFNEETEKTTLPAQQQHIEKKEKKKIKEQGPTEEKKDPKKESLADKNQVEKHPVEKKPVEKKPLVGKKQLPKEKRPAKGKLLVEEKQLAEKLLAEERQRLAKEEQLAEEKRLIEEELLAEKNRLAEEKLLAEKLLDEERQRLAKEEQLAEEKRLIEEKYLSELYQYFKNRLQSQSMETSDEIVRKLIDLYRSCRDSDILCHRSDRVSELQISHMISLYGKGFNFNDIQVKVNNLKSWCKMYDLIFHETKPITSGVEFLLNQVLSSDEQKCTNGFIRELAMCIIFAGREKILHWDAYIFVQQIEYIISYYQDPDSLASIFVELRKVFMHSTACPYGSYPMADTPAYLQQANPYSYPYQNEFNRQQQFSQAQSYSTLPLMQSSEPYNSYHVMDVSGYSSHQGNPYLYQKQNKLNPYQRPQQVRPSPQITVPNSSLQKPNWKKREGQNNEKEGKVSTNINSFYSRNRRQGSNTLSNPNISIHYKAKTQTK